MNYRNFILVMAAFALVACGGPEERKAKYRAKAQEFIEAGNYPKARVALRNVLKIDPKDADAYFLFAQVEEKEKNWRNAVGLYQEVVELVPDHAPALITLAKYYLEARLPDQVTLAADKVLLKNPEQPQAKALKIAVLAIQGSTPDALAQAEALATRFPHEPDVAVLLATLYRQHRRYREAENALRRAITAHPDNMDLLRNLSTILVESNDLLGAETVVKQMIETEPTSFDHRLQLARLFDRLGDLGKAEVVLREAINLDTNSEERRLMLADFLNTKRDARAAEQALLEAVEQLPHSTKIQFGLAELYLKTGQQAKARERYISLVHEFGKKPAGLEAQVKLAELDLASGKPEEADKRLQEVLKENPRSSDGLILTGRMAMARRNGKEAVQAFRTVLHDQPELASVHFLLGQAYQLTGEINLAKESLERAVALYPSQVDARRSLASLEYQAGRPQQARARLIDLLEQRPEDVAALDMLMSLDIVSKNWEEAEHTLERLRSASKVGTIVFLSEGRLRQAQGQYDKARAAYDRATTVAPNDPEPLLSLIRMDVALGQLNQAQARLEALLATIPGHLYGHGLLGEVLVLAGRPQEADVQFQKATSVNPKWVTPWLDWGSLWLAQKQPDRAIQVIHAGQRANPASEELYMLLASAHSSQSHTDLAIASYEGALRLNPRNTLAANNLAVLLVDLKGDPQSLQKAYGLSRDFERDVPHPLFLDTLGWVQYKMGQHQEALRILKTAVAQSPNIPSLNYHLGIALYQSGNKSEARAYLANALKNDESFQGRHEAEQALAQLRG